MTKSSAVMAMEYLVSEVKYLVKSGFLKTEVHGEGQKELECKMTYGDKGLNDDAV